MKSKKACCTKLRNMTFRKDIVECISEKLYLSIKRTLGMTTYLLILTIGGVSITLLSCKARSIIYAENFMVS